MREARGTSGAFLPHKSGVNEELRYTQKPDVNVELRGGRARGAGCSEEGGRWARARTFISVVSYTTETQAHGERKENAKRNGATIETDIPRRLDFFFGKPAAVSPLQLL